MIKCKMQVSYNILRKLVSRQILDVLVVCVYDLCEFTSVHRLFKHPHINRGVKLCIIPCICANYLSDSRTPADMSEREKVNYVKGCMQYYNTVITIFTLITTSRISHQKVRLHSKGQG